MSLFDPKASRNLLIEFQDFKDSLVGNPGEVFDKSDGVIITTDRPEFISLDWKGLRLKMNYPLQFDGKNLLNKNTMLEHGYKYIGVGQ